jgi:hypothetical protein
MQVIDIFNKLLSHKGFKGQVIIKKYYEESSLIKAIKSVTMELYYIEGVNKIKLFTSSIKSAHIDSAYSTLEENCIYFLLDESSTLLDTIKDGIK